MQMRYHPHTRSVQPAEIPLSVLRAIDPSYQGMKGQYDVYVRGKSVNRLVEAVDHAGEIDHQYGSIGRYTVEARSAVPR